MKQEFFNKIRLNRDAVAFAAQTRDKWAARVPNIAINGCIGPAGDGYAPDTMLTPEAAQLIHAPQINQLAKSGADFIGALTITHTGEGIGIVRAAQAAGMPVVISYTVETDGRLPSGEKLAEAIERTDDETGNAPIYYMINCAHPDHFRDALTKGEGWVNRIGGLRANASRLSHAELDVCVELDDGNPTEFGDLHAELATMLPNLRVIGGCCGSDARHVGCVSHHLHKRQAA
ncbi:MAG: homocysteine S-methyltransferase [Rhodobacteraceae bacterium]|nr:homocysteine S-methyltransferase [Paracoccaceae bacterium]